MKREEQPLSQTVKNVNWDPRNYWVGGRLGKIN